VDFSVVSNGAVRFSRAAEFTGGHAESSLADAVVTETRRTWMSYRIVDGSDDVGAARLIGSEALVHEAAGPIGDMLGVPVERLEYHPLVHNGDDALEGAWPLAGLLLERVLAHPTIDFAHPRETPDVNARTRQLVLGLAGLVLIIIVGVFLAGRNRLEALREQDAAMTTRSREAQPGRLRCKRDVLKLEHLRQWQTTEADWLEHFGTLVGIAPPAADLVLDQWAGVLEFRGVRYDRKAGWSAPKGIRITVDGEARDRATADEFRAALVASDLYTTGSSGADAAGGRRLPCSFTYTLRTDTVDPVTDDEPDGAGDAESAPESEAAP
jgi:hypothetical protein